MLVDGNEIEEVATLARGGIIPFARSRSGQVNVKALARCVEDVAHLPITPGAASIAEIVTTDHLGMLRQASCNAGHNRSMSCEGHGNEASLRLLV